MTKHKAKRVKLEWEEIEQKKPENEPQGSEYETPTMSGIIPRKTLFTSEVTSMLKEATSRLLQQPLSVQDIACTTIWQRSDIEPVTLLHLQKLMAWSVQLPLGHSTFLSRYAFGDVRHPLQETASLVEEIVYDQMCKLLIMVAEVAETRNSTELGIEEFIFLLRRDPDKLSRLVKRLKFLDSKLTYRDPLGSGVKVEEDDDLEDVDDAIASEQMQVGKRSKICAEFLSYIDETGELMKLASRSEHDDVKMKRIERAEQKTRDMSPDEYTEYVKCRQITFATGTKQKFRNWFDFKKLQIDKTVSKFGWDCIEYFAQETLAELVDLALLVRAENIPPLLPCETEPDARHLPLYASSSLTARAEILSSSQNEGDAKSGEKSKITSDNFNRKLALTPSHIREAMRRFNCDNTKVFLSKAITVARSSKPKILCLP